MCQKMKTVEFANTVDHDEAADNELPHPDQQCLKSCLEFCVAPVAQKVKRWLTDLAAQGLSSAQGPDNNFSNHK